MRPLADRVRLSLVGLALAPIAALGGCSASSGADTDAGSSVCRPGFVQNADGICVPERSDTGTSTTDTGVAGDTDVIPDTSATCTDGERYCNGATTAMQCQGSEWATVPCGTEMVCEEGTCVPRDVPITCTPGETLGCADGNSLMICGADGASTLSQACDAATPQCISGVCRELDCTPGTFVCDGDDLMRCESDGTIVRQETCAGGCADGACAVGCGTGKTYVGCDFWAVDLDNYGDELDPGAAGQQFAITVSNPGDTSVDINVLGPSGFEEAHTVAAGAVTSIPLPRADVDGSGLTQNAYQVQTSGPVTAHQFNPQNNSDVFSNDASLLLPSNAIGDEYLVMGWPTEAQSSLGVTQGYGGFVAIVAAAEGPTEVTVTPRNTIDSGDGVPQINASSSHTFNLEQGDTLGLTTTLINGADLTGTLIRASQPVAVFSGHECANVPIGNRYCDHLEQQLMPVDTWGTDFILAKFSPRGSEPDAYRVMASQSGTTVSTSPAISGVNGRTLGAGEFLDFTSAESFQLTATAPVSVGQFMVGSSYPGPDAGCDRNFGGSTAGCAIPGHSACQSGQTAIGDPAFMVVVPSSQFREDYIVLTPAEYREDYLNMVAPSGTSIQVDGAGVGSPSLSVAGYDIYQHSVADGPHTVTGSAAFGLYAYGYDCDVSYAYPGGLNLNR